MDQSVQRHIRRRGLKMSTPRSMAFIMAALDFIKASSNLGVQTNKFWEERRWRKGAMSGRTKAEQKRLEIHKAIFSHAFLHKWDTCEEI